MGKDLYTSVKKSTQPECLNKYNNTSNLETYSLMAFLFNSVFCWFSENIFINLVPPTQLYKINLQLLESAFVQ